MTEASAAASLPEPNVVHNGMETAPEPSTPLTVGVPREIVPGERRVALIPETVGKLTAAGLKVAIEAGAGEAAAVDDASYVAAGATIAPDAAALYGEATIIAKVQPPSDAEIALMHPGSLLLCYLDAARFGATVQGLTDRGITVFSFNAVPRTTRAQAMDAMSSMSTIGGYKAVLLAATALGRFFPLLMTAAGTVAPARVFVIGAGVAGLQALATARRLGAITEGFDTRPAVREQVQSVGAKFVDMPLPEAQTEGEGGYAREMEEDFLQRERDAIREPLSRADVVITTAMIPGKPAPLLIDEDMVAGMRAGSVIVDLAGEAGGNCTLTIPGETVVRHGITIMAPLNLPSTLAVHASQMYARNVATAILYMVKDGQLALDPDDEIIRAACLNRSAVVTT